MRSLITNDQGITVDLKPYEGVASELELPARAVAEITESEPVTKGQTAPPTNKPAFCCNRIHVMLPPDIGPGKPIVANTKDDSDQGRAQDCLRISWQMSACLRQPAANRSHALVHPGRLTIRPQPRQKPIL